MGSAAALGGVVALILLMLLQAAGIFPAPGVSAARQAALDARTAADTLASVERRLMAVEAMSEGLSALRTDVAAAAGRVAALDQALGGAATKNEVDALRNEMATFRARIEQAPPSATSADLAALAARLARMEAAVAGQSTAPTTALPMTESDARLTALSARLDAAEAAIARLSTPPPAAPSPTADARAGALASLRRAVDAGQPFVSELDLAAAMGADAITNGLRAYASSGVATRDSLRTDFARVADAILAATASTDDSLFGRIVAGARGLVSIRPTGPLEGDDPPAIVSRMEAAVARGDLGTALGEREALSASGRNASADWAMRAEARVAADRLLADFVTVTGAGNQ
jgi:hypothetical protein